MRNGPNIRADNEPLFTRFQIFPVDNQTENPLEIRDTVGNLLWSVGPTGLPSVPEVQFNVRDGLYGALGDGTTDDTTAIQAAIDAAAAAGGGTVLFPRGTYVVAGQLSKTTASPLALVGEPGAVLDGTTSVAQTLIILGGQRLSSALLILDSTAGSRTVETALAVAAGDVLLLSTDTYAIANPGDTSVLFVASQPSSYLGEIVEVESVSGTTVTLKSALFGAYPQTKTTVYKLQLPRITLDNLEIRRNSNQAGLWVRYARDVSLTRCRITGARERCFYLQYVFGGIVANCSATDFFFGGSGTSYGLAIASSQDLLVQGCRLTGGRHAISHGGNEPVRHVLVSGCTLDSARAGNQPCLDYHYNTEYCAARGNVIRNGVTATGRNLVIAGNQIHCEDQPGVYAQSFLSGDYLVIRDNQIVSNNPTASQPGILISPANSGVTISSVDVSQNTVRGASTGIGIQPYVTSPTGCVIDNLLLHANDVESTTGHALILYDAGLAVTFTVKRLSLQAGRYRSRDGNAIRTQALTAPELFRVQGAQLTTLAVGGAPITLAALTDLQLLGCQLEGPSGLALQNSITVTGDCRVQACTLKNFSQNGGLSITAATYTVDGNLGLSAAGSPSVTGKAYAGNRGAQTIVDGGTITHNLRTTPTSVRVTPTVAGEFASVTAVSSTTFTVALRTHTGAAGTSQTVYWNADI